MLGTYGETAKSWASILEFYRDLSKRNSAFTEIAELAEHLAASPFRRAGLCALTSMHDLILGPSTRVLDNPHLVIKPDFERKRFELRYHDGSPKPWMRIVEPQDAYEVIARVMTKYASWYSEPDGEAHRVRYRLAEAAVQKIIPRPDV
jgi:hypothetical protein